MNAALQRIGAIVLRHWYVLRGSPPRVLELAYWPFMQMLMWGFMTEFLAGQATYVAQAFGVLLSAVLLWDVLVRSQLGLTISFLEEIWSRNLGHRFVTPLRPLEFAASLMVMGLIRTLIGVVPASILAIVFFGWSIYELGVMLGVFFAALLLFGTAVGLVCAGLVLRYGMGAESLAWGAMFALMPISAVYYPIDVLPEWLRAVAWALPPAHVFEGMRAILVENRIRTDLALWAALLDIAYLAGAAWFFLTCFARARRDGRLLQTGE